MLYSYITKNLIGLQDIILENLKQNENYIYIYVKMPRKEHICPCCGKSTDKIHDYRKQYIKDIPAFGKLTYIVLNKRRYVCSSCKKRFYEKVDFVSRKHQSTNGHLKESENQSRKDMAKKTGYYLKTLREYLQNELLSSMTNRNNGLMLYCISVMP